MLLQSIPYLVGSGVFYLQCLDLADECRRIRFHARKCNPAYQSITQCVCRYDLRQVYTFASVPVILTPEPNPYSNMWLSLKPT